MSQESEKAAEQVAIKKMRVAKRMGTPEILDPSHSGKKKGQRFNPEDRFSRKDEKKENAAQASKSRDTSEN